MIRIAELRDEVAEIRRESGGNPRIHPNGFIQLDLEPVEENWHASHKKGHSGASKRLHIWNPPGFELPHQSTVNEIHDHVFDMRSTVVRGRLWQYLYELEASDEPQHEEYEAVYAKNSDSRLKPTGKRGTLRAVQWFPIAAGASYTQPAFTLHDSSADGLVVTVMRKTEIHDGIPHVICPIGQPPDNSFDRASAMPAEEIWAAIDASLA